MALQTFLFLAFFLDFPSLEKAGKSGISFFFIKPFKIFVNLGSSSMVAHRTVSMISSMFPSFSRYADFRSSSSSAESFYIQIWNSTIKWKTMIIQCIYLLIKTSIFNIIFTVKRTDKYLNIHSFNTRNNKYKCLYITRVKYGPLI